MWQNQFIPKMIHMFSEARGRADRRPEATIMLRNKKIDKKINQRKRFERTENFGMDADTSKIHDILEYMKI